MRRGRLRLRHECLRPHMKPHARGSEGMAEDWRHVGPFAPLPDVRARRLQHPIVTSLDWQWCSIDEVMLESE